MKATQLYLLIALVAISTISVGSAFAIVGNAPVITLTGSDPQIIEVNNAYTELGATANDTEDGDLTSSIIIDASAVNTSVVGSYSVSYTVTDSDGNTVSVNRTVNVVDTSVPVITLTGSDPQVIEVGTAYSEQGATVSDANDVGLVPTINATAVNTNVVGSYQVTYDVTDPAGNVATQVIRTVNVVDTSVPVITLVGSDPQTVLLHNAYVEQGATVSDANDVGLNATINSSAVDVNTIGSYQVTYDVTDPAGNIAVQVIRTVNVVAGNAPVLTITGNNPESVLLHNAYTDQGATATDVEDGNLTGSIITSGTVDVNTIGSYPITYDVTDSNGNHVQAIRTVNVVTGNPPVITLNGNNPDNVFLHNAYVEQGATASDVEDGNLTGSIIINGTVDTNTIGTYQITYDVTDSNGNHVQEIRTVDVTAGNAPVLTIIGNTTQTVLLHNAYTDQGATATDVEDGNLTGSIITSGTVDTNTVGTYQITYDVTDSNGNHVQVIRTVDVIAGNPPTLTISGNNPETILRNSAYLDAGATASDVEDGNLTGSIIISGSVNTSVVGTYQITYDVTDSNGNTAQAIRTVNVVAGNAPVLTLNGMNPTPLNFGEAYVEQGATATDIEDGNLTGSIIISGSVNSTLAGSYQITYDVTDSNGNHVQAIRTVNVGQQIVYTFPSGGYASAVPSQAGPSLGGTGNHIFHDGFVVNGKVFDISKYNNQIPKQAFAVGDTITIRIKEMPLYGSTHWQHIGLYLGFNGMDATVSNALVGIVDDKSDGSQITDSNGFLTNVGITSVQMSEGIEMHTIQFKVAKTMPDSNMIIRVWDDKRHSVDVHVNGAIQFGIDSPKPKPVIDPNVKTFTDYATLQNYLKTNYYESPQLLAHIHNSASMFGNNGGSIFWTINTATNTITINAVDRDGNTILEQSESLIKQPLSPQASHSYSQGNDRRSSSFEPNWIAGGAYNNNHFKMPERLG